MLYVYFRAAKLLLFSQISKKKWKKHRKIFILCVLCRFPYVWSLLYVRPQKIKVEKHLSLSASPVNPLKYN